MLKPTIISPQIGMFGSLADQLDQTPPFSLGEYNRLACF
jgi:hypothetical protein